jgi:hypothetical protein
MGALRPQLSLPGLTGQSSNLCAIGVTEAVPHRESGGYWIVRSSRTMTAKGLAGWIPDSPLRVAPE